MGVLRGNFETRFTFFRKQAKIESRNDADAHPADDHPELTDSADGFYLRVYQPPVERMQPRSEKFLGKGNRDEMMILIVIRLLINSSKTSHSDVDLASGELP